MQIRFKRLRAIFCGVLASAFAVSSFQLISFADNTTVLPAAEEGYTQVADNSSLSMYADEETGDFQIIDKASGKSWFSAAKEFTEDKATLKKNRLNYGSALIIDYVVNEGFTAAGLSKSVGSYSGCISGGEVNVTQIKNGIRVDYDFQMFGIKIPVEYKINGNNFYASILTDEIKEGKENTLYRIHLLPSFCCGGRNDSGEIFVPDGCGALIDFNNGAEENSYEAEVYGAEKSMLKDYQLTKTETIRMPVFGVAMQDRGTFGVITKGDTAASIKALSGNADFGGNMVYSILEYRAIGADDMISQSTSKASIYRISKEKYSLGSYDVRYGLLSGSPVTYYDIAESYRDYLIKECGLNKNGNMSLLNLNVYGTVEIQGNFIGFKYKTLETLTTFEEAKKIAESLKKSGIDDISMRYIGWQNDGPFNLSQLKKSSILGKLGGKKKLLALQDYLEENSGQLICDADLMQTRKGGRSAVATTMFNKKAYQYQYLRSTYVTKLTVDPWLMVSNKKLLSNSASYLKSLNKNLNNISLSTLTNLIYSDFDEGNGSYRSTIGKSAEEVLNNFKKSGKKITGDNANAYSFDYLNSIYNAPTLTSGYNLFSREIPFYQIVLHGYIPMTGAPAQTEITSKTEFLKAVETGSALLYNCVYEDATILRGLREENLYSSTYTLWNKEAASRFKNYKELYEKIKDKPIIAHSELSENVMKTTFEGGLSVIVNYNYNDTEVNGVKVSARSFTEVKEAA